MYAYRDLKPCEERKVARLVGSKKCIHELVVSCEEGFELLRGGENLPVAAGGWMDRHHSQ